MTMQEIENLVNGNREMLKEIFSEGVHYLDAYERLEKMSLVPYTGDSIECEWRATMIVRLLGGVVRKTLFPSEMRETPHLINSVHYPR